MIGLIREGEHNSCGNFPWARHLFGSFLNDRKKTMITNEMAIRTWCENKTRPHLGLFLHIRS
jgi:hypothetical protein